MGADLRDRLFRRARKAAGLVEFERSCRRKIRGASGHLVLARHVPGTPEREEFLRLQEAVHTRYKELLAAAKTAGLI